MKKNSVFVTPLDFAKTNYDLIKSDRGVIIGVSGSTGEGKTTFTNELLKAYSKISGTYWDFDRMTWDRTELLEWIDGKPKSDTDKKTGLKENQLPKYSAICPDELFNMFYKRTWYEQEQIDAITTFNMCRDRRLLIVGNVPSIWDLDSSLISALRFYIYIPIRGKAWVFEQENNPFSKDRWNISENKKLFRVNSKPYKLPNFVCEINFNDFEKEEKKRYYAIRNEKRVKALRKKKIDRERYKDIKDQRNEAIRFLYKSLKKHQKKITFKSIANIIGMDESSIRFILGRKE